VRAESRVSADLNVEVEECLYEKGSEIVKKGEKTYVYDALGRLVRKTDNQGTTTYTWNDRGQLSAVNLPGGTEWRYRYDALGRRVQKYGGSQSVEFVWDNDVVLHEVHHHTGAEHSQVIDWEFEPYGFAPLAKIEGDRQYLCINDPAGTPRELISTENGTVAWASQFTPFGEVIRTSISAVDCPVRYQGQWYDPETSLHYNRFRYYDPAIGRYISPDPIGVSGGFNPYAYARNPLRWADPFGLTGRCPPFENLMPEKLKDELADARELGVQPLRPGEPGFDEAVNAGTVKWVVTTDGDLLVVPKFVDGTEIPHTVASGGAPVLAAGEAEIAGAGGKYIGVDINEHSGHYQPSPDSLQTGKDAFQSHGISFP
jgi:RHS repeat-associated protein